MLQDVIGCIIGKVLPNTEYSGLHADVDALVKKLIDRRTSNQTLFVELLTKLREQENADATSINAMMAQFRQATLASMQALMGEKSEEDIATAANALLQELAAACNKMPDHDLEGKNRAFVFCDEQSQVVADRWILQLAVDGNSIPSLPKQLIYANLSEYCKLIKKSISDDLQVLAGTDKQPSIQVTDYPDTLAGLVQLLSAIPDVDYFRINYSATVGKGGRSFLGHLSQEMIEHFSSRMADIHSSKGRLAVPLKELDELLDAICAGTNSDSPDLEEEKRTTIVATPNVGSLSVSTVGLLLGFNLRSSQPKVPPSPRPRTPQTPRTEREDHEARLKTLFNGLKKPIKLALFTRLCLDIYFTLMGLVGKRRAILQTCQVLSRSWISFSEFASELGQKKASPKLRRRARSLAGEDRKSRNQGSFIMPSGVVKPSLQPRMSSYARSAAIADDIPTGALQVRFNDDGTTNELPIIYRYELDKEDELQIICREYLVQLKELRKCLSHLIKLLEIDETLLENSDEESELDQERTTKPVAMSVPIANTANSANNDTTSVAAVTTTATPSGTPVSVVPFLKLSLLPPPSNNPTITELLLKKLRITRESLGGDIKSIEAAFATTPPRDASPSAELSSSLQQS